MVNSKQKGNSGERAIVKILNEFYNTNEFKRVPMSGAFSTIHKNNLTESEAHVFQGDIITPDFFEWVIEVKNVKDVNLYKIFTDCGHTKWDEQLEKERENIKNKKGVILVFKQNNREWLCKVFKKDFTIEVVPRMEFVDSYILLFSDLLNFYLNNK